MARKVAAPVMETPAAVPTAVLYVAVPRKVFDRYWPQPWADVLAAAERGDDGLALETGTPRLWGGRLCDGRPDRPDVAFLRAHRLGGTALHQQNWGKEG